MNPASLSRRTLLAAAAALAAGPALAQPARRVCLLGDSISAGYGLPAKDALPARLQDELGRLGVTAKVFGAARVGETTAGAAARVDRAVPSDVALCVVALGGNDLLLGLEPSAVRANIDRIVRRLKARGVKVVLAGVQPPAILAPAYARAFGAAYAGVAKAHGVLFLPDLLAGVALNPALNQKDGIHPNAQGVGVIARRLAPLVARGLVAG